MTSLKAKSVDDISRKAAESRKSRDKEAAVVTIESEASDPQDAYEAANDAKLTLPAGIQGSKLVHRDPSHDTIERGGCKEFQLESGPRNPGKRKKSRESVRVEGNTFHIGIPLI
jgi:hypothetical protein